MAQDARTLQVAFYESPPVSEGRQVVFSERQEKEQPVSGRGQILGFQGVSSSFIGQGGPEVVASQRLAAQTVKGG